MRSVKAAVASFVVLVLAFVAGPVLLFRSARAEGGPHRVFLPAIYRCYPPTLSCLPPGTSIFGTSAYTVGPVTYVVGVITNNGETPIEDLTVTGVFTTTKGVYTDTAWVPIDVLFPPQRDWGDPSRTCFRFAVYDPLLDYDLSLSYRPASWTTPDLYALITGFGERYGYPTVKTQVFNASWETLEGVGVAVWGYETPARQRVASCDAGGGSVTLPSWTWTEIEVLVTRPYSLTGETVEAHAFALRR